MPGVLHAGSSDATRACRAPSSALVDGTLHRWSAASGDEAACLAAPLDAPAPDQAFVDFRESGRHFRPHPWSKTPIPRFDQRNEARAALARLAKRREGRHGLALGPPADTEGLKQVGLSKRVHGRAGFAGQRRR